MANEVYTGTEEQNKEVFEDWFIGMMIHAGSCLCRDVLRKNKKAMWETWLEIKPWSFEPPQTQSGKNPL